MSLPWANPCLSWGDCARIPSDVGGLLPSMPSMDDPCSAQQGRMIAVKSYNPAVPNENNKATAEDNSVLEQQPAKEERELMTIVDSGACPPYKIEYFERELFEHAPGERRREAVIQTLRMMGIKVFVIEELSIKNTDDIVKQIRSVVKWTREESHTDKSPEKSQRCLLYEDMHGRLFNLVFTRQMHGPSGKWKDQLDAFSTSRAVSALVVFMRSLPNLLYREDSENIRPLYFAILIGLVFQEETSLSEMNASLLVRCTPSISSHMLDCAFRADVPRHIVLLALGLAPTVTGTAHSIFVAVGLLGACWLLLVNIGARTWHYLQLRGIRYQGYGQTGLAALAAAATGFCLPYMSHRSTIVGGKQSVEHIIGASIWVAICMIMSDFSYFNDYVVIGSQPFHQDVVNILLGCWWLVSVLCSLVLVRKSANDTGTIPDGEDLLVLDDLSPLGCKVPSLPDYEVDPTESMQPQQRNWECIASVILTMIVGTIWAVVSFSEWGQQTYDGLFSQTWGAR